jgi:DNA mismatch repair protein MutL
MAFIAPEVKFDDAFQMANAWIVVKKDQSLLLVDPKAAHERILFDQYIQHIQNRQAPIQQLLFPKTVELSPQDYVLAHELIDDLKHLGFDVADFGQQCLIINGIPADAQKGNEKDLLEAVLEYVKQNSGDLKTNKVKTLALGLAQKASTLRKQLLQKEEIMELLHNLFKCEQPNVRPNGKPVFVEINQQQIFDLFK